MAHDHVSQLLSGANAERTRAVFPPKDDKAAGGKASTVGEKFRSQLTKLMATVESTTPFFIRCSNAGGIRTNAAAAPSS